MYPGAEIFVSQARAHAIAGQGHTGSCRGQGLKVKGYHGYIQDEDGCLVLQRCACCHLECELCREWAIRYLRTSLNMGDRPPTKAPPEEPYYVHRILAAFSCLSSICLSDIWHLSK